MNTTKHRTGLAIHGSTVALSPARAATSHLRRQYRKRYHGRYRFARAVFAFDLVLLAIGLGLLLFNVALFASPAPTPVGLSLTLTSRDLVAGEIMPVETIVRVTDATTHQHVRLTWLLPPWVEVLRADPPMDAHGTVDFGAVRPAQDVRSRLSLRIRATPGMAVPFSFRLDDGDGSKMTIFTGSESRRVATSAIRFEPSLPSPSIAPGASIPLRISNAGSLAAPAVIVRLMRADLAPQSTLGENGEVRIGNLPPGEQRTVYLHVDPSARGVASFDFEIQDASRAVNLAHLTVPIADASAITILDARPTANGRAIDVTYRASNYGSIAAIATSRASSTQDVFMSDAVPQQSAVRIFLPADGSTRGEWTILPFERQDGHPVIGYGKTISIGASLPFTSRIRYYAEGGDQLGVGPLPPKVGEVTTYWVVFSLGPTSTPLRNFKLDATLGPNVQPTGKHGSVISGNIGTEDRRISWTVPEIPASPAEPVTFAFEVSFFPHASDRGQVATLVEESHATAIDATTGDVLSATDGAHTTDLTQDPMAAGKGTVE